MGMIIYERRIHGGVEGKRITLVKEFDSWFSYDNIVVSWAEAREIHYKGKILGISEYCYQKKKKNNSKKNKK